MTEKSDRPKEYDAVLGGQNPPPRPPIDGAVLGGIVGVKRRLESDKIEIKIAGLSDAIEYGDTGLNLVIAALKDESARMRTAAAFLLQDIDSPQAKQALAEYPLYSAVGVDYSQLQYFFETKQWSVADKETLAVMLAVSERVKYLQAAGKLEKSSQKSDLIAMMSTNLDREEHLQRNDIYNLPCADLRTINKLWVNSSNGRFGFSVQAKIWKSLSPQGNFSYKTHLDFGDRLKWGSGGRWHSSGSIVFNLDAPQGHLPWRWAKMGFYGKTGNLGQETFHSNITAMAERLTECGL